MLSKFRMSRFLHSLCPPIVGIDRTVLGLSPLIELRFRYFRRIKGTRLLECRFWRYIIFNASTENLRVQSSDRSREGSCNLACELTRSPGGSSPKKLALRPDAGMVFTSVPVDVVVLTVMPESVGTIVPTLP